ncbi:MAG TPA: methylamine utilization protein [Gammaproteobacteria bacterium]|nr:methylamine utilization protein [Gammaproteobacteria bacterium]
MASESLCKVFLAVALTAISVSPAFAADLAVTVSGVDGRPVVNAVITAEPVSATLPAPAPASVVIDQKGKLFRPWVTVVHVGTRLVFANHDDITHHVYSFSPAKRFSFRLHAGEQHEALLLDKAGIVVVGCNIHDWMIAYIDVTTAPYFALTANNGVAKLEGLPPGNWRVSLWHPGLDQSAHAYTRNINLEPGQHKNLPIHLTTALTQTGPRHPMDDAGYSDY